MTEQNKFDESVVDKQIIITRIFDAPREFVWKAWTEAEHIAKWFGPKGFDTRVDKHEFYSGGETIYVMIDKNGNEYPSKGTYMEIIPLEKLVVLDEFGEDFDTSNIDIPQGKIIQSILFADEGEKTKLTVIITHDTAEDKDKHEKMGVVGGYNSSFDCLDEYLLELCN